MPAVSKHIIRKADKSHIFAFEEAGKASGNHYIEDKKSKNERPGNLFQIIEVVYSMESLGFIKNKINGSLHRLQN